MTLPHRPVQRPVQRRVLNVVGTLWDVWPTINALDAQFDCRYISFYKPLLHNKIAPKKIYWIGEKHTAKILWPWKFIRRTYRIVKHAREHDVHYIISQHDDANFSVLLSRFILRTCMRKDIAFIGWIRADPELLYADKFYSRVVAFAARMFYRHFDLLCAPSHGARQRIVSAYGLPPRKVIGVHNPVDIAELTHTKNEPLAAEHAAIFHRGPVILTIGRLTQQKGQWHLIRAFAQVKQRVPRAQLIIIGDGELRAYLQNLCIELGITADVHFLPFQQNPARFMSRATVFVLPSLWETFGNVLIEAMAVGVPVISTNCPSGPAEILAADTGALRAISRVERAAYGVLVPQLDGAKPSAQETLTPHERFLAEGLLLLLRNRAVAKHYVIAGKTRAASFDIGKQNYTKIFPRVNA